MNRPKLPSRAHWDRLFVGGKYGDHRIAGAMDDAERIGLRGWTALEMAEKEAEGLSAGGGDGGGHGEGGHSDPVLRLVERKVDQGEDGPPTGTVPDPVGVVMAAMAAAVEHAKGLAACRLIIDRYQPSTVSAAPVGSRQAVDSACELCADVSGSLRKGLCARCHGEWLSSGEDDAQLWAFRRKHSAEHTPLPVVDEVAARREKKKQRFTDRLHDRLKETG